jgi:hypothetical protein
LTEKQNFNVNRTHLFNLAIIDEMSKKYPPKVGPVSPERVMLLTALDSSFADPYAPSSIAVQSWFHARIRGVLAELNARHILEPNEARIYHIYNMGYVVKTKRSTVCFDLVRRKNREAPSFAIPDDLMSDVAYYCDALFISHEHGDHADSWVAQRLLSLGKPVVGPASLGPEFKVSLNSTKSFIEVKQNLTLTTGETLGVYIYPGIQTIDEGLTVPNNLYVVVTPDNIRMGHTGDHWEYLKFPGDILNVKTKTGGDTDILFFNFWSDGLIPYKKGFGAKVIVAAHLEEIIHDIQARKPYYWPIQRSDNGSVKLLVMYPGENFAYKQ